MLGLAMGQDDPEAVQVMAKQATQVGLDLIVSFFILCIIISVAEKQINYRYFASNDIFLELS